MKSKTFRKQLQKALSLSSEEAGKIIQATIDAIVAGLVTDGIVGFGQAGCFVLRHQVNHSGRPIPSVMFWQNRWLGQRVQGGETPDEGFIATLPPQPQSKTRKLNDAVVRAAVELYPHGFETANPVALERLRDAVVALLEFDKAGQREASESKETVHADR